MRIDRLHMIAYRGLADTEIAFRPGAKLHLVHGPNMSGKSTALAAVADALYGFPDREAYEGQHFARHKSADLRIEIELSRSDDRLTFRRHKKRRDDMTTPDEAALVPQADLDPFLGTVGRDTFENAFGLSAASLRSGVDAMLDASGDAGATLFAASSGLHALRSIAAEFETDADRLFAQRKSGARKFYQLAEEHDRHRKAARDTRLTGSRWKELLGEIDRLTNQRESLRDFRRLSQTALTRLRDLEHLYPLHRDAEAIGERLRDYEDLQSVPIGRLQELRGLALTAENAAERVIEETEARDAALQSIAALAKPDPVLEHENAIAALVRGIGRVRDFERDIPRVERELREATRASDDRAVALGLADTAAMDAVRPTGMALAALSESLEEAATLRDERKAPDAVLAEPVPDGEGGGEVSDPTAARRTFDALAPIIERSRRLDAETRALAEQRGDLETSLRRLDPPIVDADVTLDLVIPSEAALVRLRDRAAEAAEAVAELRRRRTAIETELHQSRERHARLSADRSLVSRAEILSVRGERDAALQAGQAPDLVARADRLADRALDRAADHASLEALTARIGELEAEHAAAGVDDASRAVADVENDLAALCAPLDVNHLTPNDLLIWRAEFSPLRDRLTDLRMRETELAADREAVLALEAPLRSLLEELGEAPANALPVPALVSLAADALKRTEAAWRERERTALLLADRSRRRDEARAALDAIGAREAEWRVRFEAACMAANLPGDPVVSHARAWIEGWREAAAQRKTRGDMEARIEGMKRERGAFLATAHKLLGDLDQEAENPLEALERLDERLSLARENRTLLTERQHAVAERQAALTHAVARMEAAIARRDSETDALASDPSGVPQALERLRARDELHAQLQRKREAIAVQPIEWGEDDPEDVLASYDPHEAAQRLHDLELEAADLDAQIEDVTVALRDRERERVALEEAGGTDEHVFAAHAVAAEMAETGRAWLVRRAAAALLKRTVEAHAERSTGTFLARVGALLSILTDGAYDIVRQTYDANDDPIIVVASSASDTVQTIERLSQGARDQLYLSLRLAYLEQFSAANEPLPFIGDDIFTEFDTARTGAGLRTLASMSATFQPIVFTHHDSVRDQAIALLGGDVDVIEMDQIRPS